VKNWWLFNRAFGWILSGGIEGNALGLD